MTGNPCCYCRQPMHPKRPGDYHRMDAATRDHILPKVRGGTLAAENVRVCCQRCNELRGLLGYSTVALLCFLSCLPEPSTTSVKRLLKTWPIPRDGVATEDAAA